MVIPPLCIIQARLGSTRLPNKMLLKLNGETLIARAWRVASTAFGKENCVVAIPSNGQEPLIEELNRIGAWWTDFEGEESDVLGRFYHVAHLLRWHPDSVIIRYTPDDHRKDVAPLRRVAAGERLPVEMGGEAFTLSMLGEAYRSVEFRTFKKDNAREHITHALFDTDPPPPPPGIWSIDTLEQYEAVANPPIREMECL